MAKTQDNTKTMSKEMHHIMDHAQALVDATSGEIDDRIVVRVAWTACRFMAHMGIWSASF